MSNEVSLSSNEIISKEDIISYMDAVGLTGKLSASEKKMFINIATAFNLNPFKREIYCVAYGSGDFRSLSIVTGYEVYLKRAERIGKLDGWSTQVKGVGDEMSVIVTIHRKDWAHPFYHEVYFKEVAQRNKNGELSGFWKKSPIFMTKKVAIAQAFRLCFPDEFGGMPYANDELPDEMVPKADYELNDDIVQRKVKDINPTTTSSIIKKETEPDIIVDFSSSNTGNNFHFKLIEFIDGTDIPQEMKSIAEKFVETNVDAITCERLCDSFNMFLNGNDNYKSIIIEACYSALLQRNPDKKQKLDEYYIAAEKAKKDDERFLKSLSFFNGLLK